MRSHNLFAEDEKDLCLEYCFWHPFHFDYYESILYRKFLKKRKPPIVQMKCINAYTLSQFEEPELQQMVKDLHSMGLIHLMEFRKHWNNEIVMQFYASYHHEKNKTGAIDIIH
jgi:hypothetical protein